jgi:hypothetical protein
LAVYGHTSKRDWESTKLFISPARTLQIATPETPPDPLGSDIATKLVRSGGYFKKSQMGAAQSSHLASRFTNWISSKPICPIIDSVTFEKLKG